MDYTYALKHFFTHFTYKIMQYYLQRQMFVILLNINYTNSTPIEIQEIFVEELWITVVEWWN